MNTTLMTTNPRTGERHDTGIEPSSDAAVDAIVAKARAASPAFANRGREWRAELLHALAASLETHRDRLIAIAQSETGLESARLNGELTRSCFQLRLFADALRDGGYLEAAIDHAGDTPLGPQPDVRRLLIPVGPVAVFGSSNFPFAFSVPGGDTASALAAGNPVVVKAHSAHPLTSRACFEALLEGARHCNAPEGTLGIVFGQAAGTALVSHPAMAAVGFTGSLSAAEHLRAAIERRARPIPFYAELQSVNPLIISADALSMRSRDIAEGLAASVTASGGQLCTKPGIAFVPSGDLVEAFADQVAAAVSEANPGVLLNDRVLAGFRVAENKLELAPGVRSIAGGEIINDHGGYRVNARILRARAADLTANHTIEAFGPLVLLVDYDDDAQLRAALSVVPDSLTTTLHIEDGDEAWAAELLPALAESCGRVILNGFPTVVRVSWAQHHGGPWPSTNSLHTSVGVTAIRRFLRPFAWQNSPESLLPMQLRDGYRNIPRRVDGHLVLADD